MREVLTCRLERAGFAVVTASTTREALRAADERAFDIALLDWRLSDESGLQLMLELKSRTAGLQAIILSGYADPEFEDEALGLGAFAYLASHAGLADIEATIRQALAGHPAASMLKV